MSDETIHQGSFPSEDHSTQPSLEWNFSTPIPARIKALRLLANIKDTVLRKFCETSLSPHANMNQMVAAFHKLYGLPILRPSQAKIDFSHISRPRLAMRFGLIVEEMRELFDAMDIKCDMNFYYMNEDGEYVRACDHLNVDFNGQNDTIIEAIHSARLMKAIEETDERDMVGVADATFDLKYVIIGFEYEVGIDPQACAIEGQASNMSKLAEDGSVLYREDGKVLKGPNFFKPNMRNPLSAMGLRF